MKRCLLRILPLSLLVVEARAEVVWPPPEFEMPRVAIDASAMTGFSDSLKASLGAIANTGFILFGVVTSFVLITVLFRKLVLDRLDGFSRDVNSPVQRFMRSSGLARLFWSNELFEGVRRRKLGRKIKAADLTYNLDEVVDDKVRDMEVSHLAKKRYRLRHPQADLEEKIYQREVGYQADQEMMRRHPDVAIEKGIRRKEIGHLVDEEMRNRYPDHEIDQGIHRREVSHKVDQEMERRGSDVDVERSVYRKRTSIAANQRLRRTSRKGT